MVIQYLLSRALQMALALVGVSTILFLLMRISGDPVALMLGPSATPENISQLRSAFGFDEPLAVQYVRFLSGVAGLNFGESIYYRQPSLPIVFERLPATLALASAALAIAVCTAFPLGIIAALSHRKPAGHIISVLTVFGQSMPVFWLGVLLIIVFAEWLRWLPAFGSGGPQHLVLPAIALAALLTAKLMRLIRSGLLDVMGEDYVRTAAAKGLGQEAIIRGHALRNMLIPVVTVLGLELAHLVGGAVITESVFSWPGLGLLLVKAVLDRDYPVVQATVFVVTVMVLFINLAVDLSYRLIDPRIRVG